MIVLPSCGRRIAWRRQISAGVGDSGAHARSERTFAFRSNNNDAAMSGCCVSIIAPHPHRSVAFSIGIRSASSGRGSPSSFIHAHGVCVSVTAHPGAATSVSSTSRSPGTDCERASSRSFQMRANTSSGDAARASSATAASLSRSVHAGNGA